MRYFQFLMSPIAKHHITGRPSLEESFVSGRVIDLSVDGPLVFQADTTAENPPPDYTGMLIPIMSDQFVDALRAVGIDNLQCFDARFENPETGESWDNFKAVNVIGLVSCADLGKSIYEEMGGGLYSFSELVVDPERAQGQLFFRVAEAPATIIAHQSVGDYLYGGACPKMTGFRFWPTDAESLQKLRNAPLP